jgi:hypothetical protein
VEMKAGTMIANHGGLATCVGTFSIHESRDPVSGRLASIFRLTDATVVERAPVLKSSSPE